MHLPMMNIEYIVWSAFPKEQWTSLLNNIRIGEYVYSLPVTVPDDMSEVVFPLLRSEPVRFDIVDLSKIEDKSFRKIRFNRETYIHGGDKVDVWKRVQ